MMNTKKVDIIIPAYKAHGTMMRCLSSIMCQTAVDDVNVVIVNDCCPEGDYGDFVAMFSPYMQICEIQMEKNGGPGLARQLGVDRTCSEFITYMDADDVFMVATAVETMLKDIQQDKTYMISSGSFYSPVHRSPPNELCKNMIWVFGKIYRRSFLEKYGIKFNGTRANEDTCYNQTIWMLCDNPQEQIHYIEENLVYYMINDQSITRMNDSQYYYDQGICGAIDNGINAIEFAKKFRPFSERIVKQVLHLMLMSYLEYAKILEKAPPFAMQAWEFCKKLYHTCYKQLEGFYSDEVFRFAYSDYMRYALRDMEMRGVIITLGVREFMERLRTEEYDPNFIHELWGEMWNVPFYRYYMENNIACGVCPEGYAERAEKEESNEV